MRGTGRGAPQDLVAIDQLPKAVVKSIKEAYPKDTILQVIRVSTGTVTTYEISLDDVSSMQPLKVIITSDGKIQKR